MLFAEVLGKKPAAVYGKPVSLALSSYARPEPLYEQIAAPWILLKRDQQLNPSRYLIKLSKLHWVLRTRDQTICDQLDLFIFDFTA